MKRVEAIRQRISNATPGPWEWDADVPSRYDEDYYVENAPWLRQAAEPNEAIVTGQIAVPNPADAALIASAPPDLTWLLDRLERAEEIYLKTNLFLQGLYEFHRPKLGEVAKSLQIEIEQFLSEEA